MYTKIMPPYPKYLVIFNLLICSDLKFLTVQLMTRFVGEVPLPSTLSGFLKGTSGGVVHKDHTLEGSELPTLFLAMTRKV